MVKACKGVSLSSFAKDSKRMQLAIFAEFGFRWRRCANSYFCPHLVMITKVCKNVYLRVFASSCIGAQVRRFVQIW